MKHLWSPWRLEYLIEPKPDVCVFCAAAASEEDRANLVLFRGRHAFLILNRFPYNNGHALIVPNAHKGDLADLADDEMLAMMTLARDVMALYGRVLRADGYNVGFNFGRVAGAGLPEHLHLHLVPRWSGDTNFMTVVGDVRVLPEDLGASVERLRPVFARLASST